MALVELLVVADRFELLGRGLVVLPDFRVPANSWTAIRAQVEIVRPDGEVVAATARLETAHFRFSDPAVPTEKRWRVVVMLEGLRKDQVPIGTRVMVPPEVREAVVSGHERTSGG